jgi:hypothetical protein
MRTARDASGDAPGPPLKDAVAQIESPTLAHPGADHTDAIRDESKHYEHAVISFYDDALR